MIKEFMVAYPRTSIVLISFLVIFAMTIVTKYFTNQRRMREIKDRQKELNKKSKEHKHDKDKMMEIQKEIFEGSMEMMKHSMRPMLFTFLPLILIFGWIRGIYTETAIAGSWFWWYFISGIASSIALRKILNVA